MLRRRNLRAGKKRGGCVGQTGRGKGTKLLVVADGAGVPVAVRAESAAWAEVKLLEGTLAQTRGIPARVVADRGYDSDPLRERLAARGIELICPYRRNNRKRKYEDGRKLRRRERLLSHIRRVLKEAAAAVKGQKDKR